MTKRSGCAPAVVSFGNHVDDLVESTADEIHELELGHRTHAGERSAEGGADDGGFRDGSVNDALRPEAVDEAVGDFECAAVNANVLAQAEDGRVALHFLPDALADGFEIGEFGHFVQACLRSRARMLIREANGQRSPGIRCSHGFVKREIIAGPQAVIDTAISFRFSVVLLQMHRCFDHGSIGCYLVADFWCSVLRFDFVAAIFAIHTTRGRFRFRHGAGDGEIAVGFELLIDTSDQFPVLSWTSATFLRLTGNFRSGRCNPVCASTRIRVWGRSRRRRGWRGLSCASSWLR